MYGYRWIVGSGWWIVDSEETLLQLKLRTETEAEPEAIAMPLCSAERRQSGDCGCIYRVECFGYIGVGMVCVLPLPRTACCSEFAASRKQAEARRQKAASSSQL